MTQHKTVMLEESVAHFEGKKIKSFFDGTLGAGGFAQKILQEHPEIEIFVGCDRDKSAIEIARDRLSEFKNVVFIHDNFANIISIAKKLNVKAFDGIFFDLGVSSMQIDQAERGFSFMKEGPLDMRMDQNSRDPDAKEWVNTASEKELARIFFEYGEERGSRQLARAIVQERRVRPFKTTADLANFIEKLFGQNYGKKHRATQVFQALRIAVNEELLSASTGVKEGLKVLAPQGRMGVISFHSLEDRLVKNILREASKALIKIVGIKEHVLEPLVKLITKKPLRPTRKELAENKRCRSASLRVVERF
ncbi:16S rRNA (cytosine(1402)-N(4))-methyltransferase [Candidatus Aerophobetes bacterium]|uniref:Ribosomal RNA small subunit methyltransferase H n=1 Tax=Aerophobetes bacterium TaxID=2030807 RepID=A0A2A4X5J8_UNCAE|nr:MAG: 16S rRNA (cytosine(1402)-N(4))-methyltransferase [Candidatus Aerophobetes bacterium]